MHTYQNNILIKMISKRKIQRSDAQVHFHIVQAENLFFLSQNTKREHSPF